MLNYDGVMSSLPPSSRYVQNPDSLVDDSERESLAERLSDAYTDGRLPQDDYMDALDAVYRARTLGELAPVVANLPAPSTKVPAIVATGSLPAGQVAPARNVLRPALLATAGGLVLLLLLAVMAGVALL